MVMPRNLFFVRHGYSEGNKAQDLLHAKKIEISHPIFSVPDHKLRLTKKGVEQAEAAGVWFRENFSEMLYGFVSPFCRTMETALHMNISTRYRRYNALVERNWAAFNTLTEVDRENIRGAYKKNPIYTPIGNGQSIHDLIPFNYLFFSKLHRKYSDRNVIAVCHGERMWSMRYILEQLTDSQYEALESSKNPSDRIRNCQILQYTRIDPHTKEELPHLDWYRSFCPWDLKDEDVEWKRIKRKLCEKEDLEAEVSVNRRYLSEFSDDKELYQN